MPSGRNPAFTCFALRAEAWLPGAKLSDWKRD